MVDAKTPAIMPSTEDTLTVGTPHCPVGKQDAKAESLNTPQPTLTSPGGTHPRRGKKNFPRCQCLE